MIVPWNDPRRGRAGARRARARGDPRRADPGQHGPRPAAPRASSSCSASAATDHGALLVFDEVITGFRVARGGAQELYGVARRPDDHGQGDRRRPARRGLRRPPRADGAWSPRPATSTRRGRSRATRSRSPPGSRRSRELDAAAYERLGELTELLAAGLRDAAAAARRRGQRRLGARASSPRSSAPSPVARLRRRRRPATSTPTARFCRAMLERGVYPPPSQFEAWFVSLAHDEAAIERTGAAAAEALRRSSAR